MKPPHENALLLPNPANPYAHWLTRSSLWAVTNSGGVFRKGHLVRRFWEFLTPARAENNPQLRMDSTPHRRGLPWDSGPRYLLHDRDSVAKTGRYFDVTRHYRWLGAAG